MYSGIHESVSIGTHCIHVARDHCCSFKREVLICEGQFPEQRRGVVVAVVRNEIWSFIGRTLYLSVDEKEGGDSQESSGYQRV